MTLKTEQAKSTADIQLQDISQQCQSACSSLIQLASNCWNQNGDGNPTGEESCLCNSANADAFNDCSGCEYNEH